MATSTQTKREWWAAYLKAPSKMVGVDFPAPANRVVSCLIAKEASPVFAAVAQIMATEPYLFRETAGGTYNPRPIGTTGRWSLHAYGVALDLNPRKNPQGKPPPVYDYPASFIERMEGIKAADGKPALRWGGRWSDRPDSMHWEIDRPPSQCHKVTWDKGEIDVTGPNGEPNWDQVSDWAKDAWTQAWKAGVLSDTSKPQDIVEMEQLMVLFKRAKVI